MGKTKTACVGRFLVDVPVDAEMSLAQEMIDGFEIASFEESETGFGARIAARESGISARGMNHRDDGEGGMVEARDLRISGVTGRVFVFGHSRGYYCAAKTRYPLYLDSAHGAPYLPIRCRPGRPSTSRCACRCPANPNWG